MTELSGVCLLTLNSCRTFTKRPSRTYGSRCSNPYTSLSYGCLASPKNVEETLAKRGVLSRSYAFRVYGNLEEGLWVLV